MLQGIDSADDGKGESGCIEVDGQLGPWIGPKGEVSVAGKNHQTDLLAFRNDLIVGLQIEGHFVEPAGHKGITPLRDRWFWGSAQPRVMMLSVIRVSLPFDQGRETIQTERFAAGLLLARRMVIRAVPERCTGSFNVGVVYIRRCSVNSACASASPLNEKLSVNV